MKLQIKTSDANICIKKGIVTIENVESFTVGNYSDTKKTRKLKTFNPKPRPADNYQKPYSYKRAQDIDSYKGISVGDEVRCINAHGQSNKKLCLVPDELYEVTRLFNKRGVVHVSLMHLTSGKRCGTSYDVRRFVKCC